MSAILTILGRATRDPEMQQGKNSGTEYVSLDIAVSQRGQDGKEETIYYQCYFNKFLAERLAKAGVKKGTGLMIYGDLELHPFIYQKGKNAGQANAGPRINVKDWHFVPSNRSDSNTGHPGANQTASRMWCGNARCSRQWQLPNAGKSQWQLPESGNAWRLSTAGNGSC